MENSTKALIIAAAVFITIMIISLALIVYNRGSEAVDGKGDLTEYQIQQFNEKFIKYQGDSVSASDVKALLNTVFYHNIVQENGETCVEVNVDYGEGEKTVIGASPDTEKVSENIKFDMRFEVSCTIDEDTHLINNIIAKRN